MKSKNKIGMTVLLMIVFTASLGYLMRQLYEGHKAESAFQSLAEQMSEMETEAESKSSEEAEASESEEVLESSAASDKPIPLPVIKKGTRKTWATMEETTTEVTEPEGENPPSAGVTEAETQTAVPSVSVPTVARPVSTPSAPGNQPRFYNNIPNCIGWLRIEGTAINYPVMQSKNDPDFYLHHAVSGEYSFAGVPYLDYRCEVGVSNHLVIYGHNMKNGTMFHNLRYYASRDFWQSHRRISLTTVNGQAEYEVMAVIQYNTNRESFRYNSYTNLNAGTFQWFLQQIQSRQIFETGVTASFGDELLTLSTCDWTYESGRLLVIARRSK